MGGTGTLMHDMGEMILGCKMALLLFMAATVVGGGGGGGSGGGGGGMGEADVKTRLGTFGWTRLDGSWKGGLIFRHEGLEAVFIVARVSKLKWYILSPTLLMNQGYELISELLSVECLLGWQTSYEID